MPRQKITTFLWFDDQAEEAARFYVSVFRDSQVEEITPGPGGKPLVVGFRLAGVPFLALNGGPHFRFNEAVSLYVDCADQDEIDDLWERLSEGGEKSHCGWLKDRYGLSWQIVPSALPSLLSDPARAAAVMEALMPMGKIDVAALQRAAASRS
jgi:predicted 3-demethylubiquinone-9 3-methyltransferase (glyoxalase superfamily)